MECERSLRKSDRHAGQVRRELQRADERSVDGLCLHSREALNFNIHRHKDKLAVPINLHYCRRGPTRPTDRSGWR